MRRSRQIKQVFLTFMLIVGIGVATEARQVKGVVKDKITGTPLANVVVKILQTGDSSQTSVSGIYVFPNVPDGSYTFLIGKKPYVPMIDLGVKVPGSCCVGTTGNIDASPDNVVDISDVFALIDFLSSGRPINPCLASDDVNRDGAIDIGDVFALIDYLSGAAPLPLCP